MANATVLVFSVQCHFSLRGAFCHTAILYGLTSTLLCVPFNFALREKCQFSGRYMMASICIKLSVIFLVSTLIAELLFKEFVDSYCCVTLLATKHLTHSTF